MGNNNWNKPYNGIKMKKKDDKKLIAFVSVILSVIGFVIAYALKKDDKYIMFYAKQSLVLFIFGLIIWVAGTILSVLTFGLLGIILIPLIQIFWIVLWVIQMIYSLSDKMKYTPIIGRYADRIKL